MLAELANPNHFAVAYLCRAAVNSFWYYIIDYVFELLRSGRLRASCTLYNVHCAFPDPPPFSKKLVERVNKSKNNIFTIVQAVYGLFEEQLDLEIFIYTS